MKLSLGTKIFLAVSIVLVSFGLSAIFSITRMERLWDNVWVVKEGVESASAGLKDLVRELGGIEDALELEWMRSIALSTHPLKKLSEINSMIRNTGEKDFLGEKARKYLQNALSRLTNLISGRNFYSEISANLKKEQFSRMYAVLPPQSSNSDVYEALINEFNLLLIEGRFKEAGSIRTELDKILRLMRREILKATQDVNRGLDDIYVSLNDEKGRTSISLVLLTSFALLLSLAALFWTLYMLKPVRELISKVRRISDDQKYETVKISSSDEIGELAKEFNQMVMHLRERDEMLEKQRENLIRSERLAVIGKMASMIAHEIRNPLNSITLNAEMVEKNLAVTKDTETLELIRAISGEADRLNEITEQYLRYAHIPKPSMEILKIDLLIKDLFLFMKEEINKSGINVNFQSDIDAIEIKGDENQLKQVFLNILRNAVEAMKNGGELKVRLELSNDNLLINIEDTGSGIPEENLEKIFTPFFTTKSKGTGLGLALSQQIIAAHGGRIDVQSNPGEGTAFTITLPCNI
jgi:signal transduction histidine kinase